MLTHAPQTMRSGDGEPMAQRLIGRRLLGLFLLHPHEQTSKRRLNHAQVRFLLITNYVNKFQAGAVFRLTFEAAETAVGPYRSPCRTRFGTMPWSYSQVHRPSTLALLGGITAKATSQSGWFRGRRKRENTNNPQKIPTKKSTKKNQLTGGWHLPGP